MSLIKTSFLNGIAVLVRMLALLGINKILAIHVGPSGFALVGQFQNAIQMISTFASGAINTGVVRYTAEHNDNKLKQIQIWKTAGTIAILGSLLTGIGVVVLNQLLAEKILKDYSLGGVFVWFAFGLTFYVMNVFLLGILNGKKEIKKFVFANISGSVLSLILTFILGNYSGLYGALVALGIYQSISLISTLLICWKLDWFLLRNFFGKIDFDILKKLFGYTLMALSSAIFVPLGHMLIRTHISKHLGMEAAGFWEAIWRISAAYLLLVTSTLSVYYLPRLSELKTVIELRKEINYCFKIIIPFTVICSIAMYLLRDIVISILFTGEFSPVRNLFFWQMIGDSIKICSWLFGYIYAARGLVWLYVCSEFIFSFLFYALVVLLIPYFGLEGTVIAHVLTYLIYFPFVFLSLKVRKII